MARKPNYDFERRKKELDRKNRKEARKEERARRKAAGLSDDMEEGMPTSEGDSDESESD